MVTSYARCAHEVTMPSPSAAKQLKSLTAQKECPGCVVITSPDRMRRDRALRFLLDHFADSNLPKPQTFSFGEQGRTSPQAFLRDLAEPSLFEPVRFAVLRQIESAKAADLEPVSEFIRKNISGVHLFIIGESLPNTPTFKKTVEAHATLLAFEALKGAELRRWIERETVTQGISGAQDDVMELLSSLGEDDPDAIARLIEKFALYLGEDKASKQALKALEPTRVTASDFELAETLLGRNRAASETLLLQLTAQGSSPFMLMGLLTKTFVSLYRIRILIDKGLGNSEIKNAMNMSPWLFSKYLPLAQKLRALTLSAAIDSLLIADFRLKDRSLGPAAVFSAIAAAATDGGRR
jgi:DNA polymerase III delta subunit